MELKQLRVLQAVGETGSFSAAADRLDYTQPAVSKIVATLERQLGTTLVDRGIRPLRLTEAGSALAQRAAAAFEQIAAAELEVEAIANLSAGSLRVGTFSSAGAAMVVDALRAFRKSHPDVDVSITEIGMPSAAHSLAPTRRPRPRRLVRLSGDRRHVQRRSRPGSSPRRSLRRRRAARPQARTRADDSLRRPGRGELAARRLRRRQPQLPHDRPSLPRRRLRPARRLSHQRLPDGTGARRRGRRDRTPPTTHAPGDDTQASRSGRSPPTHPCAACQRFACRRDT